jgi:monovalent cation:H+ antiporter-2, CPA2 family
MLHSRAVRPEPLVKPKREVTQPDDALPNLADETLEKAE